jgi:hypothetical protein
VRLRLNLFLPQVENLESQVREQSLALQKAEASAAEALTQLQAAQEKVCFQWVLYFKVRFKCRLEYNLNHGLFMCA